MPSSLKEGPTHHRFQLAGGSAGADGAFTGNTFSSSSTVWPRRREREEGLHLELYPHDWKTSSPSTFLPLPNMYCLWLCYGKVSSFLRGQPPLCPRPQISFSEDISDLSERGQGHQQAHLPSHRPGRKQVFPPEVPALSPAHQPLSLPRPPPPAGPRGRATRSRRSRSWQLGAPRLETEHAQCCAWLRRCRESAFPGFSEALSPESVCQRPERAGAGAYSASVSAKELKLKNLYNINWMC